MPFALIVVFQSREFFTVGPASRWVVLEERTTVAFTRDRKYHG